MANENDRLVVVEVPQWQGSGAPTARRLVLGARLLSELIPTLERVIVEMGTETGEQHEGVRNADVLVQNLTRTRAAFGEDDRLVVTVGGDCGVELAPVEAAHARYGDRLAVVWFDAHGDLNTPGSSPSGAFHGMILRTLLGEGPARLRPTSPLDPNRVVLAGARALDPGEQEFIRTTKLTHLGVPDLAAPHTLIEAVTATGADAVYVHIDLDVLDPREFPSVGSPEPHGVPADHLVAAVRALATRFTVAGIGITEYEPQHTADPGQDVLTRLLKATFAQST